MGRKRTRFSDNPIAKNLHIILQQGEGFEKNIKILESKRISRDEVNAWISGRRNPQYATLVRIAGILNININLLTKGLDDLELLPEQIRIIEMVKKTRDKKVLRALESVAEIEEDKSRERPLIK